MSSGEFRLCVVGVFCNKDGRLLVGKRRDNGAWQLPQGGVDDGETPRQALYREMKEELGLANFRVLAELDDELQYEFPSDLDSAIARRYRGQSQRWFKCELLPSERPNLELASDDEFTELDWFLPEEVLAQVIFWKLEVYQEALRGLGFVSKES